MFRYYLEKGITPEYILSLPSVNRLFYKASYMRSLEIELEKLKLLLGGNR
nr:MAG TPA: hypothetical protein [Caudoviricetes sp.]